MYARWWETDSIHLTPESIDNHTNGLIAWNGIVGVADIELDCHSDLAFVAREVPAVEGNICGFHGGCSAVVSAVAFAVAFAARFVVGTFWHDQISVGGNGPLFEDNVWKKGRSCECRQPVITVKALKVVHTRKGLNTPCPLFTRDHSVRAKSGVMP